MYSAVVLTLNEEKALPGCLSSLASCSDIVVLDSGSTDGTLAIAERGGARFVTHPFTNFADQRNYAQKSIEFRFPWVLHLDADERMTPELHGQCLAASERSDLDGFRIAPRMMFKGRWIRHCTDYPAYQARFVRAPQFEFAQVGHGQREAAHMRLENLSASYLHDISIYGEDAWVEKHRRYARDEARQCLSEDRGRLADLVSGDSLARRRALKKLSFRLPLRPQLRFAYQYGLRGGFLDGRQGLEYCKLLLQYERFVADEISALRALEKSKFPGKAPPAS